jgi:hypothetical protein
MNECYVSLLTFSRLLKQYQQIHEAVSEVVGYDVK